MGDVPEWIEESPEEIEETVVELAEKGHSPSKIGIILRDQYGVPDVNEAIDKRVMEILEEHGISPDIPPELMDLMRKAVRMRGHLGKHTGDVESQRSLESLESKIHKLTKYYKKQGSLPQDWRYDPEEAALLVRG